MARIYLSIHSFIIFAGEKEDVQIKGRNIIGLTCQKTHQKCYNNSIIIE